MAFSAAYRSRIVLLLGCLLAPACEEKPSADLGAPRVPSTSVSGPGRVRGRVLFCGVSPSLPPLKNEPCCDGAPPTVPDESFILGDGGTLANCFVYVDGGPRTTGATIPMATLDQKNCRYVPHLVGVVVGQTLRISSSDATTHNVHYAPRYSADRNHWMKAAGESTDVTFNAPEIIRTSCDVHPWMSAHIGIFDNPFFAVTDLNGSFDIGNLPAGKYKLIVWHERYGRLEQPLVIEDGTPIDLEFTYQPPAR